MSDTEIASETRVPCVRLLAPCPFCGYDACYLSERDNAACCPACGAIGPDDWTRYGDNELTSDEMWNKRANTTLCDDRPITERGEAESGRG